jgi:hypothetical protein
MNENQVTGLDRAEIRHGYKVCTSLTALSGAVRHGSFAVLVARVEYSTEAWAFRPTYRPIHPKPDEKPLLCGALCVFSELSSAVEFVVKESLTYESGEDTVIFECEYVLSEETAFYYRELGLGSDKTSLNKQISQDEMAELVEELDLW